MATVTNSKKIDNRLSIEKDRTLAKLQLPKAFDYSIELTEAGFIQSFKNGYLKALDQSIELFNQKLTKQEILQALLQERDLYVSSKEN